MTLDNIAVMLGDGKPPAERPVIKKQLVEPVHLMSQSNNAVAENMGGSYIAPTLSIPPRKVSKKEKKANRSRLPVACVACRRRHSKCPGGNPCSKCIAANLTCEYIEPSKKVVVSMTYLLQLQEDMSLLKKENVKLHSMIGNKRDQHPDGIEYDDPNDHLAVKESDTQRNNSNKLEPDETIGSNFAQRSGRLIESTQGQTYFVGSSSMTLFGIEIQGLITKYITGKVVKPLPTKAQFPATIYQKRNQLADNLVDPIETVTPIPHDDPDILEYGIKAFSKNDLKDSREIKLKFPHYTYALLLVDTVLKYNDGCFYFFNEGLVKHELFVLYSEKLLPFKANPTLQSISFCKLFLIFAIGEIYLGSKPKLDTDVENIGTDKLPGLKFFNEGSKLFHCLFSNENVECVTKEGGVETLLLYAFYLQIADCTVASYFYFGEALRACLILGMHVDAQSETLTRFELEHQRRLWWTVYIYERMLSSKAGLPLSFTEYTISTELPQDFEMDLPGGEHFLFSKAESLTNTIQIVRINASILNKMYQRQPFANILPTLQNIFKQLIDWKNNLSVFCQVDFSKRGKEFEISRQCTNLFTEYFQGINLAVRPLLFHFTILQLKRFKDTNAYLNLQNYSKTIATLLNFSLQASVNTIRALWHLKGKNMVAVFGYMDREYLFTSSCTLLLFNVAFGIHEQTLEHLDHALTIFTSMKRLGNQPAELRRAQLLTLTINLDFHDIMKELILKHTKDDEEQMGHLQSQDAVETPANGSSTITKMEPPKSVFTALPDNSNNRDGVVELDDTAPSDRVDMENLSSLVDIINASMEQSYSAPLTEKGTKIIEKNVNELDPINDLETDVFQEVLDSLDNVSKKDNLLWKEISDQAMWLGNAMDPTNAPGTEVDFSEFLLD
ncbi:Put3p KNAG_0H00250 [Huiozyma naganishii CBS 8797]|uniref:Zn(2)-C6 fungal-type domain-containing protein n=1 Tax=Huiozyma naganishii (strain ATCC MYA-139 / BCRC 22969 / CBS 8797 / KCTC 17520 / NBRC 10181 / NCYC 3082 / Yp74L-3) TaxID=1071383 RepID=J7S9C5_HUIN7|nr:hypothetical protein KNAG_0H00250 [Kazachstania naganishii CBS 8797]CCK71441.1 hypothetical protein KNAG_0H00250 [Kazachstania naganishii CBS 8797]